MYILIIRGSFSRLIDLPLAEAKKAAMRIMTNRNERPIYCSLHTNPHSKEVHIAYGTYNPFFAKRCQHGACSLQSVTPITDSNIALSREDTAHLWEEWEKFDIEALACEDYYYERPQDEEL